MNNGYLIYQAERTMSGAEQRAADACRGELAASLARLLRSATAPLGLRRQVRTRSGQAGACAQ